MTSCAISCWDNSKGKISGIISSLGVTGLFLTVKASQLPPLVPFLFRCFFVLVFFTSILFLQSTFHSLRFQLLTNWKLLCLRSFVDGLAVCLVYCSSDFFPLTKLGFLSQTQPAIVMLTAFIIFREKPSVFQFLCGVGAICGSIFVFQPPVLGFPLPDSSLAPLRVESKSKEEEEKRLYMGIGIIFTSLTLFAISTTLLRIISSTCNVHWALPAALQAFIGIPLSLLGIIFLGQQHYLLLVCTWQKKLAIGTLSMCSVCVQCSVYYALKFEKSSLYSILMTSQVFFMPMADYCLYGSLPSLNVFHYFGFTLTLSSVLALFVESYVKTSAYQKREENCAEIKEINANLQSAEISQPL